MNNRILQIWILLIHIAAFVFFYIYPFKPNWLGYGGQGFAVLSMAVILASYSKIIKRMQPFNLGINLLRDQDFSTKLVKTGNKHIDQAIELFNTMLDQLKKEKTEKAEQEYFMNMILESSPLGVIVLDFDEKIYKINPAGAYMLQLEIDEAKGTYISSLKNELGKLLNSVELNKPKLIRMQMQEQYRITRGQMIDRGHNRQYFIIEELTDDIHRAEKNAWEKLIRVMAHEVNNTVGSVNSILSSINETLNDPESKKILNVASKRNTSLNRFINQYASIVKLSEPQKQIISIKNTIDLAVGLLRPLMSANQISFILLGDDFTVSGDQPQLEQVILNIVQNAIESFDGSVEQEKKIQINIYGEDKKVTITNNGQAIPENIKPQLFSPFFTTKTNGNGIGLMLTSEILQKHQCKYRLTSENGYTSFQITFQQ